MLEVGLFFQFSQLHTDMSNTLLFGFSLTLLYCLWLTDLNSHAGVTAISLSLNSIKKTKKKTIVELVPDYLTWIGAERNVQAN